MIDCILVCIGTGIVGYIIGRTLALISHHQRSLKRLDSMFQDHDKVQSMEDLEDLADMANREFDRALTRWRTQCNGKGVDHD